MAFRSLSKTVAIGSLPLIFYLCASPFFRAFSSKISASIEEINAGIDQTLKTNSSSEFIRFKNGEGAEGNRTRELQIAVVSYRESSSSLQNQPSLLQVDLVPKVHMGDKEYFDTLQKGLQKYDCVLYEMDASRKCLENITNSTTRRLKSSCSRGSNIDRFIRRQEARFYFFDFQDRFNYQAENWLFADLDSETYKMLQLERGENVTLTRDMVIRLIKALLQPASIPEDLGPWRSKLLLMSRVLPAPLVRLLIIVCSPSANQSVEYPELQALSRLDIEAAGKIFMAKVFISEFTQMVSASLQKSFGNERNRVATEELQRAINSGHKRIAMLYAVGHMPDLGRRLHQEFDLVPSQVQWITAWSIRNRELGSRSLQFLKTLSRISCWPLNRYQTVALFFFYCGLLLYLKLWKLFFHIVVNVASWVAN